jgi:hypothetical protein
MWRRTSAVSRGCGRPIFHCIFLREVALLCQHQNIHMQGAASLLDHAILFISHAYYAVLAAVHSSSYILEDTILFKSPNSTRLTLPSFLRPSAQTFGHFQHIHRCAYGAIETVFQ